MGKYILITPARNEGKYIKYTIESVLSQTFKPMKWLIVSDNSTDRTEEIVSAYERKYDFINLIAIKSEQQRNFASQVYACNEAYKQIKDFEFQYLGFLDGDMSLEPCYYEEILGEFNRNPFLGIAGGMVLSKFGSKIYDQRKGSEDHHVAGGVQMFRLKCYEEIGGYIPLKAGGQDVVAEVMARMKGWEVKTFLKVKAYHLKPDGPGIRGIFKARFQDGVRNNLIGTHPIYHIARCVKRSIKDPFSLNVLWNTCTILGFIWSWWRREKKPVQDEYIEYFRKEQMKRLCSKVKIINTLD